jgi:hypothetical protein
MSRWFLRIKLLALALFLAGCPCGDDDDGGDDDDTSEVPSDDDDSSAQSDDDDADDGVHGRIEEIDGIEVLHLWGTREEMGYAEGALYCHQMPGLFKSYILEYLVADYGVPYEMIQALVENAIALDDGDLAEMEALFQGAEDHCSPEEFLVESEYLEEAANGSRELEFGDLVAANILGDFGCSSFSVWGEASATGDTLHARNFDWAIDPGGVFLEQHILKTYDSSEQGGARYASVTVPGLIGCMSCISAEGRAITMHNVGGLEATQSTGIYPRMLATRAALAATWQSDDPAASAEAVLEAALQRVGNNLHLSYPTGSDSPGGAVVFEYDGATDHEDGQATVREPGYDVDLATSDAIACTNHYVQRTDPPTEGDSYDRHHTLIGGIDASVATGGLDAAGAHDLIASVANGYTAHSVVVDSAAGELWVFVAPEPGTPATDAEPHVVDLATLFDGGE